MPKLSILLYLCFGLVRVIFLLPVFLRAGRHVSTEKKAGIVTTIDFEVDDSNTFANY